MNRTMTNGAAKSVLVAGLGNVLLRDDGVGVHSARLLSGDPPEGTEVAEIGTAILGALHLFDGVKRVLVIDAMKAGGVPGTIYRVHGEDIEDEATPCSVHELGFRTSLRLLGAHKLPEIVVLGVEPEIIEYGLDLSPRVAASLPRVINEARAVIAEWATGSDSQ